MEELAGLLAMLFFFFFFFLFFQFHKTFPFVSAPGTGAGRGGVGWEATWLQSWRPRDTSEDGGGKEGGMHFLGVSPLPVPCGCHASVSPSSSLGAGMWLSCLLPHPSGVAPGGTWGYGDTWGCSAWRTSVQCWHLSPGLQRELLFFLLFSKATGKFAAAVASRDPGKLPAPQHLRRHRRPPQHVGASTGIARGLLQPWGGYGLQRRQWGVWG